MGARPNWWVILAIIVGGVAINVLTNAFSDETNAGPFGPNVWTISAGLGLLGLILITLGLIIKRERPSSLQSYSDRVKQLTGELSKTSGEIDLLLREMHDVTERREKSLNEQDAQLKELTKQQQEKKDEIADLSKSAPETVNRLIGTLEKQEQQNARESARSFRRDVALFMAGLVSSSVLSVALHAFGLT